MAFKREYEYKTFLEKCPNQKSRIASIPTRADRHGYARLNANHKTNKIMNILDKLQLP